MTESHHTGNSPIAQRLTLPELAAKRQRGERLVMVTAYDAPSARLADGAGVDIILVRFSPGARTYLHAHHVPQILHCIEGRGILATETERNEVGPGDVVHVLPNEMHWHGAAGDEEFVHLSIRPPGETTWTKTDPLAWQGKGELTKILQDVLAFSDSLDLCKFSAFAEGPEEYAAQYSAVTGQPFTAADVLKTGERIYNLERLYNNLAGLAEGSDYLPDRFTKEPSTMPGSLGHVCELDQMLAEYYQARGWVNGVVPDAKLQELEIDYQKA